MHQWNGLYLILTNPIAGYEAAARAAVDCHVSVLQLRMKDEPNDQQLEIAQTLRTITHGTQTQFIINDNLPLAQQVEADGLHLGQDDLTLEDARQQYRGIIGISTHNLEQALQANQAGADYIGIGPLFPTQSKINPAPRIGITQAAHIAQHVTCPTVVIGGIQPKHFPEMRRQQLPAYALISAVHHATEPQQAITQLQRAWQEAQI
jgi:thiamine-phosphate pyrophosphorylase